MLPELIGSTKGGILSKFKCAAPPFVAHPGEILQDVASHMAALSLQVSKLMAAVGVCVCSGIPLSELNYLVS